MFAWKLPPNEAAAVAPSEDMADEMPLRRIFASNDTTARPVDQAANAKGNPFPDVDDIADRLSDRIDYC